MSIPVVSPLSRAAAVMACAFLTACNTLLPASGPYTPEVLGPARAADDETLPNYELVVVNPQVVDILERRGEASFVGAFTDRKPAREILLGAGDIVNVTIFEAAAGGLFIPEQAGTRPGNFVQLPAQSVDRNGNISVPYAGLVRAAGKTIPQVQQEVEQRLKNRAIEPQVVIAVQEQRSAQVSVLGEVRAPLRFAANPSGERVLDAIARGGGPSGQGYETFVTLHRGTKQATISFNKLVAQPQNNIFVQSGDTIYLYREQRAFMALGASGLTGRFNFDAEKLTLADAVGRSGGLLDDRADPGAVFLYRLEDKSVAASLGIDARRWPGKQIPVIYSLNFRDATGFFNASRMPMQNRDILFVANAATVDIVKALQVIRVGISAVREGDATRYIGR